MPEDFHAGPELDASGVQPPQARSTQRSSFGQVMWPRDDRRLLQVLLQAVVSCFGYVVEHAYTLRCLEGRVYLRRALVKMQDMQAARESFPNASEEVCKVGAAST